MNLPTRIFTLTLLAGTALAASLTAQVKLPKPPDVYDVEFRYRIKAGRNERIVQFGDMMKFLKKLDFKRNETEDSDLDVFDPNAERMNGTIPSATARELLVEPHIQTVVLVPAGFKLPADDKERVKVLIELNSGFSPPMQRQFSLQIKEVLAEFGFQEAVSYDHRGYTVLRGAMFGVKVPALLKDLRTQPSGWFLPLVHENDRPDQLNSKLPIRLVEVLPEEGAAAPVAGQAPLPPIPPDRPYLAKLSAELRRRLEAAKDGAPVRVEATLDFAPAETDNTWKESILVANPTTAIEGLMGNVVTLTVASGDQIANLARLASIVSIRLPRAASMPQPPPIKDEPQKEEPKKAQSNGIVVTQATENFAILKETRLDRLHAQGNLGTGQRIGIIDTDFTGWEKFVGKELPRSTHYVDLTAERNSEIRPEPRLAPEGAIGHGVHCALAVRYAAPDADIVLVRISPEAPYQVLTSFRYMRGDFFQPQSFRIRREELEIDAGILRSERTQANEQYRKAFDNFDDDEPSRERKREAKAAIARAEKKEKDLTVRAERLLKLERDLLKLGGTQIILNTVGWNSGQPLDATSVLSRYLDEKMTVGRPNPSLTSTLVRIPQPNLWFQPAGDTRGQAWFGPFRDADDNGIMEFAPFDAPLQPNRWSPELNFLGFRSDGGPDEADLPANTRLRITIQWREAHDPEIAEAEYRTPIAPLNLLLLRQRDPGAEKLASDEMEIMARSEGNPDRLAVERGFAVYEQAIELTLPAAGRYALRVEGRQPLGVRPGGSFGLREQEVRWELRPRIFLEVVDVPTRSKGRVVFADYESFLSIVAVPADARSVVAVGAMQPNRRPEPFSAIGAGLVSELFVKPDVMTYDRLPKLGDGTGPAKGSALAAALATGQGACLLSAGAESANFLRYLRILPGSVFEVPTDWLRK